MPAKQKAVGMVTKRVLLNLETGSSGKTGRISVPGNVVESMLLE